MNNIPVQRHTAKNAANERLRPVVRSIVASYAANPDEATDLILRLLPAPLAPAEPAPNAQPKPTPARSGADPRASTNPASVAKRARAPRAPPPLPDPSTGARQLTPFEWYSIEELEAFLGIKRQMIWNIQQDDPELLVSRKESDNGQVKTLFQGKGIIALRHKRQMQVNAAVRVATRADSGVEEEENSAGREAPIAQG